MGTIPSTLQPVTFSPIVLVAGITGTIPCEGPAQRTGCRVVSGKRGRTVSGVTARSHAAFPDTGKPRENPQEQAFLCKFTFMASKLLCPG